MPDLFELASQCIVAAEPDVKLELTHATRQAWLKRTLSFESTPAAEPFDGILGGLQDLFVLEDQSVGVADEFFETGFR